MDRRGGLMSPTGEELYRQREQRFNDIVALKKPDRAPVVPLGVGYFVDLWKGYSYKDAGYNHPQHYEAIRDATIEFGWDLTPMNTLFAADGYEAIGTTQLRWPGGELPDDTGFQFVEGEYMRAEEYDEFLADPNGFTLRKIFPRIATNLAGFEQVPIPPLYFMANTYYLLNVGGPLLGAPPLRSWPRSATPVPLPRLSSRRLTWSRTCFARCAAARWTCTRIPRNCSAP